MAGMMSQQDGQLHYAPPPRWYCRRRWRRAVVAVVVAVLLGCGLWWGRPAIQHMRLLYWQRQCLTYAAPSNRVVYEGDPAAAAALLSRRGYANPGTTGGSPAAAWRPRCWVEFDRLAGTGAATGIPVFLHERRSTTGARRLVVVQHPGSWTPAGAASLPPLVMLIEPASLRESPKVRPALVECTAEGVLLPSFDGTDRLRVFAGQADPHDMSHFTIAYELNGQPGRIDGWLRGDGDRLELKVAAPGLAQSGNVRLSGKFLYDVVAGNLTIEVLPVPFGETLVGTFAEPTTAPGAGPSNGGFIGLDALKVAIPESPAPSTQPRGLRSDGAP